MRIKKKLLLPSWFNYNMNPLEQNSEFATRYDKKIKIVSLLKLDSNTCHVERHLVSLFQLSSTMFLDNVVSEQL